MSEPTQKNRRRPTSNAPSEAPVRADFEDAAPVRYEVKVLARGARVPR